MALISIQCLHITLMSRFLFHFRHTRYERIDGDDNPESGIYPGHGSPAQEEEIRAQEDFYENLGRPTV